MPGELSEGSFHDYFPETRRLMNNSYRKMEAYGILDGFLQVLRRAVGHSLRNSRDSNQR